MPTLDNFNHDHLFAGGIQPVVTDALTLKSGQSYVRGTVIGLVTATGEATIVNSTATDGSQTSYAILAEDVDATAAAKSAAVYLTGEFNENALTFGGTDTADTHRVALRKIGIFLKTNQEA